MDDPEKQISVDDFIRITEKMDGRDYYKFMQLPIEQRVEIALEILKGEKHGDKGVPETGDSGLRDR